MNWFLWVKKAERTPKKPIHRANFNEKLTREVKKILFYNIYHFLREKRERERERERETIRKRKKGEFERE